MPQSLRAKFGVVNPWQTSLGGLRNHFIEMRTLFGARLSKTNNIPFLTGQNATGPSAFSTIPQDVEYGVDMVYAGFDVPDTSIDLDSPLWSIDRWGSPTVPNYMHEQLFYYHDFQGSSVEVEFRLLDARCYLRFNPSRAVFGKSRQLLPAEAVEPLVGALMDELFYLVAGPFYGVDSAGEIKRLDGWADHVSLSRVDCARNLWIDDPTQFKKITFMSIPLQNPMVHSFGQHGKSWGLVHGTKTVGQDRLYDKNADLKRFDIEESLTQQEGEWFRFEAELRGDRLTKYGMKRLSSLTSERVWEAIEGRWEATRWDVSITEPGSIVSATEHLSVNDKISLFGYMEMHLLGLEQEIPESRHRKYKKMVRDLGLHANEPIETQGEKTRTVSIWEGRLVDHNQKLPLT